MTNPRVVASAILVTALLVVPSFAHHNISAVFDLTKQSTLKGNITSVEFRNPHSNVYMDVKDAVTGKIVNWWIEIPSVATLTKAGLDKSMIDLNQTYSIEVFSAKDGSPKAVGITLIFPDSKSFDIAEKPAAPLAPVAR